MERDFPESDWEKLRAWQGDLLEISCGRILEKITVLIAERKGGNHDCYLKLWDLMRHEDKELSDMFDDLKRSNAILKLALMRRNSVIPDERFEEFSDKIKFLVDAINE
ncbi:MAG TPA: hypothetical protein VMU10_01315 [Desulfomonilia bacterium]|nr:hypothetical protein [Desulfomonilia bacterium]